MKSRALKTLSQVRAKTRAGLTKAGERIDVGLKSGTKAGSKKKNGCLTGFSMVLALLCGAYGITSIVYMTQDRIVKRDTFFTVRYAHNATAVLNSWNANPFSVMLVYAIVFGMYQGATIVFYQESIQKAPYLPSEVSENDIELADDSGGEEEEYNDPTMSPLEKLVEKKMEIKYQHSMYDTMMLGLGFVHAFLWGAILCIACGQRELWTLLFETMLISMAWVVTLTLKGKKYKPTKSPYRFAKFLILLGLILVVANQLDDLINRGKPATVTQWMAFSISWSVCVLQIIVVAAMEYANVIHEAIPVAHVMLFTVSNFAIFIALVTT